METQSDSFAYVDTRDDEPNTYEYEWVYTHTMNVLESGLNACGCVSSVGPWGSA